jgi:GDP-L-fucose synthase
MASRLRLVGRGFPIRELAETVARVIGYRGETHWDPTKPDGTPRNLMDSSRLRALGWQPQVPFEEGIAGAYRDFLSREQGA